KHDKAVVERVALVSFGKAGGDHTRNAFELQCCGRLLSTRASFNKQKTAYDITAAIEGVEIRIVIFKRYCRHFFRSHIVAISVFAAVNAVGVQIVFIHEENATAHTWWKTGNDLYRACWLRFLFGAPNRRARGALGEILWRTNKSSQRAGRYHGGRTQIYVSVAIAHTALEIAIGSADGILAFLHQTASQADAGSATRRQWNGAGSQESLPIAISFGLGLHLGAGRRQIKFDPIGDVSAAGAHHFGGVMQVLEARIHARQQICLLNGHMLSLHFRE